jgi:hypothetical protein
MSMTFLQNKWEELKKALAHKQAFATVAAPAEKPAEFPTPSHQHLMATRYGSKNIPGSDGTGHHTESLGFTTLGKQQGKGFVVRHGASAFRTGTEHAMAKLLGADHMVPQQSYDSGIHHPLHYQQGTYNVDKHGGTSLQAHHDGASLEDALQDPKHEKALTNQWQTGDLHKLWALHYVTNNGDMHSGNFKVDKDGVKAFDSSQAFHELPFGHVIEDHGSGPEVKHMPGSYNQLPSYLAPFIERENNDEGIDATHSHVQPNFKELRQHANMINPEAFAPYGKHAVERATQVKTALASPDPTRAMLDLWDSHKSRE